MTALARRAAAGAGLAPDPAGIAALAHEALMLEVLTAPKPGLVSHVDRGSHDDMTVQTFRASADAIRPFLAELAAAGSARAPMAALRRIGLRAETAMMAATGGVNTHRGTIFGLGLLCAAAGMRPAGSEASLGGIVSREWGAAIASGPIPIRSHGTAALRRHGAGGARLEAASGFPSLYRTGLPALRDGRRLQDDDEAARVHCLFALLGEVRDTNLLHRGGAEGAAFARDAARGFMDEGGVGRHGWRDRAEALHRQFVARRLSPGGCADLLAMTLFVDAVEDSAAK